MLVFYVKSKERCIMQIDKPIRVLHVFGRVGLGGAESRIMDMYRNIDRSRIQFDFLVHFSAKATGKKSPTSAELMAVREPDFYDEEIKKLGGNIYVVPRFEGTNLASYRKALENFFAENKGKWDYVQGHMTSTSAIYIPIAKRIGKIGTTITHVRSAGVDPGIKGIVTKALRLPLRKKGTADYYFACSEKAGRAVYGDKLFEQGYVKVIPNAVDVQKFSYNSEVREKIRKELGITEDTIIIGHVGRFDIPKNHSFFVQILESLVKKAKADNSNKKFVALFVGQGLLMENIKKQLQELNLQDNVIFAGQKQNVNDYYQAMDYFLFPSLFEGLPGTVVEAQSSVLRCLISDTITTEVDVTDLVSRMSIEQAPDKWADKIMQDLLHNVDREEECSKYIKLISDAGFDVKKQAQIMTYFYEHGSFE